MTDLYALLMVHTGLPRTVVAIEARVRFCSPRLPNHLSRKNLKLGLLLAYFEHFIGCLKRIAQGRNATVQKQVNQAQKYLCGN